MQLFCVMSLYFLLLNQRYYRDIFKFSSHWSRKYQNFILKNRISVGYLTICLSENISCMIKFVRKLFRRKFEKMSENISAEVFPLKFYPPKFLGVNVLACLEHFWWPDIFLMTGLYDRCGNDHYFEPYIDIFWHHCLKSLESEENITCPPILSPTV